MLVVKISINFSWISHHFDVGAFIYDVRCFSGIFDLPTYPHQILYYISLFSKIRWGLTYLPTQKSDVIYECSLRPCKLRYLFNINKGLGLLNLADTALILIKTLAQVMLKIIPWGNYENWTVTVTKILNCSWLSYNTFWIAPRA